MNKQLSKKDIQMSVSIGTDVIVSYLDSEVFAEIEGDEIFMLIKNKKDPSKDVKIFVKGIKHDGISDAKTED